MVCTKCKRKIGRKEPLCTVYVRPSTGMPLTCTFCANCSIEFTKFVVGDVKQEEKTEDGKYD